MNHTEQLTGRELDAAVAVNLFGFDWWRSSATRGRALFPDGEQPQWFKYRALGDESLCTDWDHAVPRYSESIEAAMQVVERLRAIGVWTLIAIYHHTTQVHVEMGVPSSECQEWGATAAEAICKCALKAQTKFELFAERLAALRAINQFLTD